MVKKTKLTENQKNLTKRYLIWCYKTTKEELDKVDRYFTQLEVDNFMLDNLYKTNEYKTKTDFKEYKNRVNDFKKYMDAKKTRVLSKKFKDQKKKRLDVDYLYLKKRLESIEKAICSFLNKKELAFIQDLYEEEMTMRIMEAREHT